MVRDVQAACARAGEVLAGAPLDDGDVDARQRQLARQHQPRRTASGDHHRMLGHRHVVTPIHSEFRRQSPPSWGTTRGLRQAPRWARSWRWKRARRPY